MYRIVYSILLVISVGIISFTSNTSYRYGTIPTLQISYHLISKNFNLNTDDTLMLIKLNNELNNAFSNICQFKIYSIDTIQSSSTLWKLYKNYTTSTGDILTALKNIYQVNNTINIYIYFNGTVETDYYLLGFTSLRVLSEMDNILDFNYSDAIFVSKNALLLYADAHTLIHEMGHFFGLKHPFSAEMTREELSAMGLTDINVLCTNYMNYNCYTDNWTLQQRLYMKKYIMSYRSYLFK